MNRTEVFYRTIGSFVALVLALLLLGCKTQQSVHTANLSDSTVVHHIYDTTRITVNDTLHAESSKTSEQEQLTEIVFADGGGSYNAQTGQAEGVKSVKSSNKVKELQQTIISQQKTIDAYSARIDSLQQTITNYSEQDEIKLNTADIKPKTSSWHKFLVWWFVITLGLIILRVAWWAFKKYYLHI